MDSMVVESGYDGAKLEKEMTQEFVDDMIQRFKDGKKIHRKYVFQIILAVKEIVYAEPTMVETKVKPDHKLTVCGDTHGKFPRAHEPLYLLNFAHRPIFRSPGNLPVERFPLPNPLLSIQRRLRRPRILVH